MMYPEIINIIGFPFVYNTLPNNGPTTFPIDNIVCLAPIIFPLFSLEECFDNSFCSNGVMIDLLTEYSKWVDNKNTIMLSLEEKVINVNKEDINTKERRRYDNFLLFIFLINGIISKLLNAPTTPVNKT